MHITTTVSYTDFFVYFLAFKAEDEKGEQLKRVCSQ